MRDIALAVFVLGALPFVLWRPTIGVFLWVWISVMNPHRLTWEFTYDMPFAHIVAVATIIGLFLSNEQKRFPLTQTTVVLLLFVLWMNVTTIFALDIRESHDMWERVMKIQFMVLVALLLLHSKQHVQVLMWTLAASVGFFAVKGGIFTLVTEGQLRVYGPPESFIADNNAMALAAVMTLPLLRYLHLYAQRIWVRYSLVGAMIFTGFAILGSYSRGAFLAMAAMLMFFWLKGRHKLVTTLALLLLLPFALDFMPEKWTERMWSIQTYQEDPSALGRINSWMTAVNIAKDRPLVGGGFGIYTEEVFDRYAPDPLQVRSAHSNYFQMLGEHGFVGLVLYLLLGILVWRDANWIVRAARGQKQVQWASDLALMIQVSLVGYAVGGAFLNLAYYDIPYNLLVVLVATRFLVAKALVPTAVSNQDRSLQAARLLTATREAPKRSETGASS